MKNDKLNDLRIDAAAKTRPKKPIFTIFILILGVTAVALFYALPKASDTTRLFGAEGQTNVPAQSVEANSTSARTKAATSATGSSTPVASERDDIVLTVSGYIIARERIELSPRFMGVVEWIGVKKGDAVTNGQVVVLLDDAEYQARLLEAQGRLEAAKAALEKAQIQYERVKELASLSVESKQMEDDMRLNVASAEAVVAEIQGQIALTETYIDWCVIRSPIDGVVLEKLVDPNELVTPQSFGGTRGPSTALVSLADLQDLQVEVDLNESDVAKVEVGQKCRISPEAYPEKVYDGFVAEKAPEANRQKGTLQVKVQILNPDKFLTPELTAKVDFLRDPAVASK